MAPTLKGTAAWRAEVRRPGGALLSSSVCLSLSTHTWPTSQTNRAEIQRLTMIRTERAAANHREAVRLGMIN